MTRGPDAVDFGLREMPGRELHDVLRALRERGPVQPTRYLGLPAFVVTGHAALLEAFRDVERFPPHRMYERTIERAVGRTFISMEDPEHRAYRKLATPAFRSRAVERYEREGLAALAHELVDALEGREAFDLVEDFTARFPYLVISRLLGLPRSGEEAFHRWALAILRFPQDPAGAHEAAEELTAFLGPVVEARRRDPRGDVISELLSVRVDGRALGAEEIASHVRLLLPTGGETTYGSLGNLLYALLTHREVWEALRADPSRVPAAVDEALRWETPVAVLPRLSAREPVAFGGHEIPPDSWVLFAIAGANRDPDVFPDPDRFEPERRATDALTFGRGVKSCPGMHLARKSMAVALETLLERLPGLALCDSEAALPRRTVLRSPAALRVRRGSPRTRRHEEAPETMDREHFRKAVEARDLDAMLATFAEDAVLHSPVTFHPFEGREAIRMLLGILLEVFEDFRYTDALASGDGDTHALVFRARVGERELEGLDLIRFDDTGRIRDFTVMVRPRSALEALLGAVAPRLAAARGGA